jgi:hypothetical protein
MTVNHFSSSSEVRVLLLSQNSLVVQLVRMPPCHGGGRGFESRPDCESYVKSISHIVINAYKINVLVSKHKGTCTASEAGVVGSRPAGTATFAMFESNRRH